MHINYNYKGRNLSDSSSIADEFNAHFSSCVSNHSQAKAPGQGVALCPVSSSFKFVKIDEETVMHYLNHLDVRKATGTDGLSAKLLRTTAPGIAASLAQLFKYSLEIGQIPSEQNAAHVTPVHKKGDELRSSLPTTDQCQFSQ